MSIGAYALEWNPGVVIVMNASSAAALEVVIMAAFSDDGDDLAVVAMATVPFHCICVP